MKCVNLDFLRGKEEVKKALESRTIETRLVGYNKTHERKEKELKT